MQLTQQNIVLALAYFIHCNHRTYCYPFVYHHGRNIQSRLREYLCIILTSAGQRYIWLKTWVLLSD